MSAGMAAALARIERKLDMLIAALADDEEGDAPQFTLDGEQAPCERNQDEPL